MGKITVIGAGSVGAAVANDLMVQGIASEILLVDVNKKKAKGEKQSDIELNELIAQVETIVEDQEQQQMYASELKDTLMRLRPDFSERTYGSATFGKLIAQITQKSEKLRSWTDQSSLMIGLSGAEETEVRRLDKTNWLAAFTAALEGIKTEGFERVNPSVLKSAILSDYPGFDERQIGFKRFSDVMKALEKEGLLVVEMDEQHSMLLKIC